MGGFRCLKLKGLELSEGLGRILGPESTSHVKYFEAQVIRYMDPEPYVVRANSGRTRFSPHSGSAVCRFGGGQGIGKAP